MNIYTFLPQDGVQESQQLKDMACATAVSEVGRLCIADPNEYIAEGAQIERAVH